MIPINSLEIPNPGIKGAGVQTLSVAGVYIALASVSLYLLKGQKNGFGVVVACGFENLGLS